MAIIVEHEKRKRKILEKALDVFVEEGYEDVTFQKIADRCGITRTTLYIYFKNKREIFFMEHQAARIGNRNDDHADRQQYIVQHGKLFSQNAHEYRRCNRRK